MGFKTIEIKSKYKFVSGIQRNTRCRIYWQIRVHSRNKSGGFKTEREAAIAVDKKLIEMGKEPVNILKRK